MYVCKDENYNINIDTARNSADHLHKKDMETCGAKKEFKEYSTFELLPLQLLQCNQNKATMMNVL